MNDGGPPYVQVDLDLSIVTDWKSFHRAFATAFGFPDFYGQNMNAWIDCMTSLDDAGAGLSTVHAPPGGVVVLQLNGYRDFVTRLPEVAGALADCAAFVNWRRLDVGERPVLVLSYYDRAPPSNNRWRGP